MSLFRTKICGITTREDAVDAVNLGSEAIGLNFYVKGKRYIDPKSANEISLSVKEQGFGKSNVVGVFVNETPSAICEIVRSVGLDVVQLHGDEAPELLESLSTRLPDHVKIIRAIRTQTGSLDYAKTQLEINRWTQAGIDGLLLDAASPNSKEYGGTGSRLEWTNINQLTFTIPWILAGGLNADNVIEAIITARPDGIDLASGVESSPGVKVRAQVESVLQNAKVVFDRIEK